MTTCTLFGYWGLFTWLPTFLARPVAQGGAGLSIVKTSLFIILMQVGMIAGSVGFGFISDKLGRRFTYSSFLVIAAVVIPIYASTRNLALLLVIGPFLAFFGNGHFAGIGAMSAELFPTEIRATAQGFTYNIGRLGSFLAPILVGYLAQRHSFTFAFLSSSITYLIAAGTVRLLPETKGTVLH
jgi:MFS family permease